VRVVVDEAASGRLVRGDPRRGAPARPFPLVSRHQTCKMASKIAGKGAADRCRTRGGRAAISEGTKVPEENRYVRADQQISAEDARLRLA